MMMMPKRQQQQEQNSNKIMRGAGRGARGRRGGRSGPRPEGAHDERLSRNLSRLLRHSAVKDGLAMRPDGYALVSDVLSLPRFKHYSEGQVRGVVADNDKQRFSLLETPDGKLWVRANQGHSIDIVRSELLLERLEDPSTQVDVAVHGTNRDAWASIRQQGLRRMGRNHVHFAAGLPGADGVISGMRKTAQVLIYLNVAEAARMGLPLFRSANGVLLTPGFVVDGVDGVIPPALFDKVVENGAQAPLFRGDVAKLPPPGTWQVATAEQRQDDAAAAAPATATAAAAAGVPNKKDMKRIKSGLGKVLRHSAIELGLNMSPDGYVAVRDLITKPPFERATVQALRDIAASSNNAYSVIECPTRGWCIRANSGHSTPAVDPRKLMQPVDLASVQRPLVLGLSEEEWHACEASGVFEWTPPPPAVRELVDPLAPPKNVYALMTLSRDKAIAGGLEVLQDAWGRLRTLGVPGAARPHVPLSWAEGVIEYTSDEPLLDVKPPPASPTS